MYVVFFYLSEYFDYFYVKLLRINMLFYLTVKEFSCYLLMLVFRTELTTLPSASPREILSVSGDKTILL